MFICNDAYAFITLGEPLYPMQVHEAGAHNATKAGKLHWSASNVENGEKRENYAKLAYNLYRYYRRVLIATSFKCSTKFELCRNVQMFLLL